MLLFLVLFVLLLLLLLQVELYCVSNLINCFIEADEEFICMDFHFSLRSGNNSENNKNSNVDNKNKNKNNNNNLA